ncbi:MAG: ABC transporter substrate-binding protein [Treponema sp.]|nr:ABC transporter substrate-binding protein [Treponema sp.]
MKKNIYFIFMLVFAVGAVFAGGKRDREDKNISHVTGKINIYTSMYGDIIKNINSELKKQFPECEIEFFFGGTGTIQAKIASEEGGNKLGCDILMVAEPAYSIELKEKGILHNYISKEAANLTFDYDKDGYWYPVRISNMVLAYNPQKTPKNAVPDSFQSFANNANFRGTVSMSNPISSGTAFAAIAALRDKYGYEYFQALGRQDVKIESGAVALNKLESGEYTCVMVLEESVLKKRQEEKSTLEVIYPSDGVILIPSTIMIIKDEWSANSNSIAAEAICDWFLGTDGQNAIVSGWMHSVRSNFPRIPFDSVSTKEIIANSLPINWGNILQNEEEIQSKFEDYVTLRR